jgi:hypothetical protein
VRDAAGSDKLRQHVADLLGCLARNEAALVHYDARRQGGEPIATSFVESAVDEIISWRMAKTQQMRWSRATVPAFLDVRTAVLNDTLKDAFRLTPPWLPTRERRPQAHCNGGLITFHDVAWSPTMLGVSTGQLRERCILSAHLIPDTFQRGAT